MSLKKKYILLNLSKEKKVSFQLPLWLYWLTNGLLLSSLLFLLGTNLLQIHLVAKTYFLEKQYQGQRKLLANYQELLQGYSITYSKKEQSLNKDLLTFDIDGQNTNLSRLIGQPNLTVNGGVGGESKVLEKSDLVDLYAEDLIDKKLELFKKDQGEEVLNRDIESMKDSLSVMQRFDVELSERTLVLNYLPTIWPLKNQAGKINTRQANYGKPQTSLSINVEKNTQVVATAKGTVQKVIAKGATYSVEVRHNFGIVTIYRGLSKADVKVDDFLDKGEVLGETDSKLIYLVQVALKLADPRKFTIFKY